MLYLLIQLNYIQYLFIEMQYMFMFIVRFITFCKSNGLISHCKIIWYVSLQVKFWADLIWYDIKSNIYSSAGYEIPSKIEKQLYSK